MKEFIKRLISSLDTTSQGFSSRKLTALTAVIVAIYVTYTLPLDMRLYALYSWQLLALLCLGIVTFEQIVRFKNGKNDDIANEPTKQ